LSRYHGRGGGQSASYRKYSEAWHTQELRKEDQYKRRLSKESRRQAGSAGQSLDREAYRRDRRNAGSIGKGRLENNHRGNEDHHAIPLIGKIGTQEIKIIGDSPFNNDTMSTKMPSLSVEGNARTRFGNIIENVSA